ncbi:hypothetical protein [Streptomyces sp. NPDC001658]
MTTATLTTTNAGHGEHPDYYRGRADAYDDSATRTPDQMVALAAMAIDYASIPYARGYADRVTEYRLETDVVAGAESELAQTWLARKQGRQRSTLHTRRTNGHRR